MRLISVDVKSVDYGNHFEVVFDFWDGSGELKGAIIETEASDRYRNFIVFRPRRDSFQDVADRLREFADKLEIRGKEEIDPLSCELSKEDRVKRFYLRDTEPKPLKVEDGLDGDTPIPLDDKAIERLTN